MAHGIKVTGFWEVTQFPILLFDTGHRIMCDTCMYLEEKKISHLLRGVDEVSLEMDIESLLVSIGRYAIFTDATDMMK